MPIDEQFSMYWFDPDGRSHCERRFVSAKCAMMTALSFTQRPATAMGIVRRIIITDGGDCTCFEWKHGEGVTFPKEGQQ